MAINIPLLVGEVGGGGGQQGFEDFLMGEIFIFKKYSKGNV